MNNANNILTSNNLIGKQELRIFLEIQASYGYAQRGGSKIADFEKSHVKRIATDVNLLSSPELKKIIFSETLFNN